MTKPNLHVIWYSFLYYNHIYLYQKQYPTSHEEQDSDEIDDTTEGLNDS